MRNTKIAALSALTMLLSPLAAQAYDQACFPRQAPCIRGMTASIARQTGIRFRASCMHRVPRKGFDFSFVSQGIAHTRSSGNVYGSTRDDCLNEMATSIWAHTGLTLYSYCTSNPRGTATGGQTPEGQFCFEYVAGDAI